MIKGMSRRVIMIDSPDPEIFENAIFIIRNDAFARGKAESDILRQAQQIADEYVKTNIEKKKRRISPALYALAGAMCSGGIFAALLLIL